MLSIDALSKHFGGVTALDGVSLGCEAGTITGIIGPNGSGKSTLFNSITAVTPPDRGTVELNGVRLDTTDPEAVAHAGIARTFQIPRVAAKMTVLENVMLPARGQRAESLLALLSPWLASTLKAEQSALLSQAWQLLDMLGLAESANTRVRELSGGQVKLLSVAMALMVKPAVLMLDEPTAGVNPVLIEAIIGRLEVLRDDGMTIVIIEHNIEVISQLCSKIYVLDAGRVISRGTPDNVRRDARVVEAYLGIEGAS